MTDVMMKLGDYSFSIATAAYTELSRDLEARWASISRFGRNPALQSTGLGNERIELSGIVFPAWRGGSEQIDQLRDILKAQTPVYLVDGLGKIWGQFVVTSVREIATALTAYGRAQKQKFNISLMVYGEDIDGGL